MPKADGWQRWPVRWMVWADVAQLVEHSLGKGEVTSSILVIGSRVEAVCGRERRGSLQPKS